MTSSADALEDDRTAQVELPRTRVWTEGRMTGQRAHASPARGAGYLSCWSSLIYESLHRRTRHSSVGVPVPDAARRDETVSPSVPLGMTKRPSAGHSGGHRMTRSPSVGRWVEHKMTKNLACLVQYGGTGPRPAPQTSLWSGLRTMKPPKEGHSRWDAQVKMAWTCRT
ncbi:hypothetical protein BV25DRAFT_1391192 [Artomyces pyxidatus]|uniref:Uncharacterized protein n=1 Tax=Artomyces pyxidatus TaxID=48021 RepID=A0ACB8TDH5_9AGAM|nr:hypothetical protein BV25DRAFT_1391192 [Artomyces pyxidatus]